MGKRKQCITAHSINISTPPPSNFPILAKTLNMDMGKTTLNRLYPHMPPQTSIFLVIEGQLISNVYTARSISFAIF